jgi:hypothetical protein
MSNLKNNVMTPNQLSIVLAVIAVLALGLFAWVMSRPKGFPQQILKSTMLFSIIVIAIGLIFFL